MRNDSQTPITDACTGHCICHAVGTSNNEDACPRSEMVKLELKLNEKPQGLLESIIDKIITHDAEYPDHGVGCACIDKCSTDFKKLINEKLDNHPKSKSNLKTALWYILR